MQDCVLSFDFGAGSARLMAVFFDGKEISYREVHRFSNEPLRDEHRGLYWNPDHWLEEMLLGLRKASQDWHILSIGIDTWGADIAYFDCGGNLLQPPFCYRNERTASSIPELHRTLPPKEIYASGGNAYFPFNTIYQLHHDICQDLALGKKIAAFTFIPDFLMYLLSEEERHQITEYCIASTSALCDARQRDWNWSLIDKVGLPRKIFPRIVEAPYLAAHLKKLYSPYPIPLLKVPSHDTASAAAGISLAEDACFLICGTWFILGIEDRWPYLSETAFRQNVVTEGSGLGRHRIQKLFCGFWLLQQLAKEWQLTYQNLEEQVQQSTLFDPPEFNMNDSLLLMPHSMEQALAQLLGTPYSVPDLLKIVYHNMVTACIRHLESLRAVSGKAITKIYIVGGGKQDRYFISELQRSSSCQVESGPAEASALGNAAFQWLYHGKLRSLEEFHHRLVQP